MSLATGTTSVTVELLDRAPTIEDVQDALNVLVAEGIPPTFEVDILHSEDREYEEGVPYADRKVRRVFRITASRAAWTGVGA